ncbi:MAG: MarR family transcriptional regulator [Myxococcota bacterium]
MAKKSRELLRVKLEGYLNLVRIQRELETVSARLLSDHGIDGMTMAQATALLVLVQEAAPITATRLAGLLNVTPVTVGRFVRNLLQNGWIHRKPDPNDARAMLLEPTKKTYTQLGAFFDVTNLLMANAYGEMGGDRVKSLVRSLAEIRGNLYEASGKPDTQPQVML